MARAFQKSDIDRGSKRSTLEILVAYGMKPRRTVDGMDSPHTDKTEPAKGPMSAATI